MRGRSRFVLVTGVYRSLGLACAVLLLRKSCVSPRIVRSVCNSEWRLCCLSRTRYYCGETPILNLCCPCPVICCSSRCPCPVPSHMPRSMHLDIVLQSHVVSHAFAACWSCSSIFVEMVIRALVNAFVDRCVCCLVLHFLATVGCVVVDVLLDGVVDCSRE